MPSRSAIGIVLVVVAALVVVVPGESPAAAPDMSPAELCQLFPQDQGFTTSEDAASSGCAAKRGDCDQPTESLQTCVSGFILQEASAPEARDLLPAAGTGPWSALSGLGEVAIEACDMFFCEIRFQRDRFWVSTLAAPGLGLQPARELAARIDQEIQRILVSGPQPQDDGTPTDTPSVEPDTAAPAVDYVDVFYGNAGLEGLIPDVNRFIACDPPPPSGDSLIVCSGATEVRSVLSRLGAEFSDDLPNPTQRQINGARVYAGAVQLAGLKATDGTALFPSIQNALPVIERLSDVDVAKRFVEMLSAMDAADWEGRL